MTAKRWDFAERLDYARGLMRNAGLEPDDTLARQLVRMWVIQGFAEMIAEILRHRRPRAVK